MSSSVTAFLRMFGAAARAWWDDDAPRLGASLAYYTLFAIAPILLVATAIAGMAFGAEAVRGESAISMQVSLVVTTGLFALLFRFLPDVKLRWHDVTTGALVTAVLFTIGQQVIGLYLGQSSMASSYGAAGSMMILLLWVYYSCQILLFGAEFTRVYAQHGANHKPESFAVKDLKAVKGG